LTQVEKFQTIEVDVTEPADTEEIYRLEEILRKAKEPEMQQPDGLDIPVPNDRQMSVNLEQITAPSSEIREICQELDGVLEQLIKEIDHFDTVVVFIVLNIFLTQEERQKFPNLENFEKFIEDGYGSFNSLLFEFFSSPDRNDPLRHLYQQADTEPRQMLEVFISLFSAFRNRGIVHRDFREKISKVFSKLTKEYLMLHRSHDITFRGAIEGERKFRRAQEFFEETIAARNEGTSTEHGFLSGAEDSGSLEPIIRQPQLFQNNQ